MSVKTISKDELRRMEGSKGLILQGCGGSLDEWVDSINDMLTEDGILLDGTRFYDCSTFEHEGVTCLIFPFKGDVSSTSASSPCGGSGRTKISAAHGFRTTFRTVSAVFPQRDKAQKKHKSRTAR